MGEERDERPTDRGSGAVGRAGRLPKAVVVGLIVSAIVAWCVLSAFGFWSYVNADHQQGLLDDPKVQSAVSRGCAEMAAALDAMPTPPSDASPREFARAIEAENAALVTLTKRVRSLGESRLDGDRPAQDWLADWDALIKLRADYASDLRAGRPASFVLPTVDGEPITTRMSDPGVPCPIPTVVTALPR